MTARTPAPASAPASASTAARIISSPPEAWTVTQRAPIEPRRAAARPRCSGCLEFGVHEHRSTESRHLGHDGGALSHQELEPDLETTDMG